MFMSGGKSLPGFITLIEISDQLILLDELVRDSTLTRW
jgi:hypothetical protein